MKTVAYVNKVLRIFTDCCTSTPQNIAKRARIIIKANDELKGNREIAREMKISPCDITLWTKRWVERYDLSVAERLLDAPRSGTPERISSEQWCKIIAVACETPETYHVPMTHWTHKELAKQVIKQGIVDKISPSYIGQMLKKRFATASDSLLVKCQAR